MEIQITSRATVKEIPVAKFNVQEINKIKNLKGGAVRQNSKAPTFPFDLRRHIPRNDEQPGLGEGESSSH